MTGGIHAITSQPKLRQPRHLLARNCANPARRGICLAGSVRRRHRLPEMVVRCGLDGIHRRKQGIGAGSATSPALRESSTDRRRPGDLLSERLRKLGFGGLRDPAISSLLTILLHHFGMVRRRICMSRWQILVLAVTMVVAATPTSAEMNVDPTGVWLTHAGEAKIMVSKCGSGICGTIIWLKVPIDPATGRPQEDDKNKDPALAHRPIIGINIFNGMKLVSAP